MGCWCQEIPGCLVSRTRGGAAAEKGFGLAERLGLFPSSVLVREQRKRWGSADAKGNVRFNWRVVQAPMRLVDYVVAHGLVHLAYPDHTRDFWATLGRVMPDYEVRRETLRRMGRRMVW